MWVTHLCRQPSPFGIAALGVAIVHDGRFVVEVEHGGGVSAQGVARDDEMLLFIGEGSLNGVAFATLSTKNLYLGVDDETGVGHLVV